MRVGIDTGGTFTDVAVLHDGRLSIHKLPSTPVDPARAVLDGLAPLHAAGALDVVHGTTVGLNALLTGEVARTAFVTDAGFRDLIEIGRQARDGLYDLEPRRAAPPVPRRLRFTLSGRRFADGSREAPPAARELATLARRLRAAGVEAIAIGRLHAYAHPGDERAIARALARLGVPITCSAELLAISGEYERFVAAILNAAITPVVGGYVARLARGLRRGRVRLLRSSGGILPAAEAARFPARALLSGPAGGVLAARALLPQLGADRVATLDMGGTSTDVALVGAEPRITTAGKVAGLPLAIPSVDVHTIGCGGGSIARVDDGGALRVGPESAGADPGPACYGRGTTPTVTDAHVVLGHLGADTLLGGGFPIDPARSVRAIAALGRRLGLSVAATARGILEIAEVAMLRALLVITVERAVDPARVPLLAFGGAGGLHAYGLARRLGMPGAIVAPHPGAFSAVGLALAGESREWIRALHAPLARDERDIARAARTLARRAAAGFGRRAPEDLQVRLEARVRFAGQGEGLDLPFGPDLAARFRAEHERQFGFLAEAGLEVVALRAIASRPGVALPARSEAPAVRPSRERHAPGGARWLVVDRAGLRDREVVTGPALIEEPTGVTLVPAGAIAQCTAAGLQLAATAAGA
jgi:N-methylhydantoinase A